MTKVELLAILEQYEDDDIFLVSEDDEGNGYSEARLGAPEKAIQWEPHIGWEVIAEGDEDEYEEEDLAKSVRVGVFW